MRLLSIAALAPLAISVAGEFNNVHIIISEARMNTNCHRSLRR